MVNWTKLFFIVLVLSFLGHDNHVFCQIPVPDHWFRADTLVTLDGVKVSSWRDIIHSEVSFLPDIDNARPEINLNQILGVEFNASNQRMFLSTPITPGSIILIIEPYVFPSYRTILDANVNQNSGIHMRTNGFEARFNDSPSDRIMFGTNEVGYNFVALSSFQSGSPAFGRSSFVHYEFSDDLTFVSGNYRIGREVNSFNGKIVEILFYTERLTEIEVELIETERLNWHCPPISLSSNDTIFASDFCPFNLDASGNYSSFSWSNDSITDSISIIESGVYWVEVIDLFGRISRDTVNIQFPGTFISSFEQCQFDDSLYTTDLSAFDVEWQDGSTDANYLITEAGEYYLTVTDTQGCSYDSDTVVVSTDFFPSEVEIIESDIFCLGNELYLDGGFAEAEIYSWNTMEDTPFISPEGAGEYWVEATNGNGCVGRDTVDVVIAGVAPEVVFDVGVACATRAVAFADATVPEGGTVIQQDWIFDQGPDPDASGQGGLVSQEFEFSGNYPVELSVLLDNGCSGIKRDTVEVNPLPLVHFNYDEVIPCAGNEVAFESQSGVPGDGQIGAYYWEFSNGLDDIGIVGTTVFDDLGVGTVLHFVETTDGCIDSLEVNVVVLGSPVVGFAFDTVCVGGATNFQEMVDVSESGPVFYQWQFGDGFFSNFPNTSHVYDEVGAYEVTLKATGNDFGNAGCTNSLTQTVRVYAAPSPAISLEDGCLDVGAALVDITDASEIEGQDDPVALRNWEVVIGPSLTEVVGSDSVTSFVPEAAGTYNILYNFETAAGCTGETNGTVEVLAIPTASFILDVPAEQPPVNAFADNTSTDATSYTWWMGDAEVSTDENPLFVFPDTGSYVVSLVAENVLGCSDSTAQGFYLIDPVVDLALLDIMYVQNGTRLELSALLSNDGNVPITSFDLEVQVGQSINFTQSIETVILPGEVVTYALDTDFDYSIARILPYTCMTVSNPNGVGDAEVDVTNNHLCIGMDKERVTFIAPYPNPVKDVLHLGFVLPKDGVMEVALFSADGKEMSRVAYDLEAGYAQVAFSVRAFSEGLYVLKYGFDGEEHTERVVVGR